MLQGAALRQAIAETRCGDDQVALWWLGQSGFVLRWREVLLGIDLYLSDHLAAKYAGTDKPHDRLMPAPLAPEDLAGLHLLLATHKHSDHLDPGSVKAILDAAPQAVLVLPAALTRYAADELGLPRDRLVGLRPEEYFSHEGLTIQAVPAAHEHLEADDQGNLLCLGFVIQAGEVTLYHAGDTVPYRGQVKTLKAFSPDLMLLPINGRCARLQQLGTPGNLTIAEAARLTDAVGADVLVPHHYDLFAFNTADIERFRAFMAQHYPNQRVHVCRPGEGWVYPEGD